MICGIIAPRQRHIVGNRDDYYLAECILQIRHDGPHLIKTPEGLYYAWEDDNNCDCCQPSDEDRCIIFWQTDQDQELIKF